VAAHKNIVAKDVTNGDKQKLPNIGPRFESLLFQKPKLIGVDPLDVARSSWIHEIYGREEDEHEEHDTQIKGKHTHTQDTHRLSSLARFTNSIESQGRDSKSRIPCERLICLE
jgi:hypothetical protein